MTFDANSFHSAHQDFLHKFLDNGWFIATDPENFLLGWGPAEFAPDPAANQATLFSPEFVPRVANGFLSSQPAPSPWLQSPGTTTISREQFFTIVMAKLANEVNADPAPWSWREPQLADFARQFSEIKEAMASRGLIKAVPVVFAESRAEVSQRHLLRLLARALKLPSSVHPFGWWRSDGGGGREGILGATPELFCRLRGRELTTIALAGTTAKAGKSYTEATSYLLNDLKERREHQLVVDDIVESLRSFGAVSVGQTEVVELPTLFHLRTPIAVQLFTSVSLRQVAAALHPTAALGVVPRMLGFSEMARWSDFSERRGRFGAPFGASWFAASGEVEAICYVAIRCMQWNHGVVRIGSGCGVVAASQLEREWQELKLKRDSVRRLFDL